MTDVEIVPLELAEFEFPDPELADVRGVVIGYALRHTSGVLLFDTGFGFGNAELDERYHPVARPILEVLRAAGIERTDITAVANCHLHADHAGQNGAFDGTPIHVQASEWALAHTVDHTILEWIDTPGATYEFTDGDREIAPSIRVVATPGHTRGHQSLLVDTADGPVVLAGQACYTVGEWIGDPEALEGRTSSPDPDAYGRSIRRLKSMRPVRVYFAHDRAVWTPDAAPPRTPAILPGPC